MSLKYESIPPLMIPNCSICTTHGTGCGLSSKIVGVFWSAFAPPFQAVGHSAHPEICRGLEISEADMRGWTHGTQVGGPIIAGDIASQVLEILKTIGLSNKEAKVYQAALVAGEAPASQIAQLANLKRPTTYLILSRLVELGYVATQSSSRSELFRACNPMLLLKRHKTTLSLLDRVVPELMALSKNVSAEPGVETFYGLEGIEQGWDLCLEAKNDILYFADQNLTASVGSPDPATQRKIDALRPEEIEYQSRFVRERVQRGIWIRGIIPFYSEAELASKTHLAPLQRELIFLKRKGEEELREFYFVPRELFSSKVELTTFNDKVLIISYSDAVTCVITSEGLAATVRAIFGLCLSVARTLEPNELTDKAMIKEANF